MHFLLIILLPAILMPGPEIPVLKGLHPTAIVWSDDSCSVGPFESDCDTLEEFLTECEAISPDFECNELAQDYLDKDYMGRMGILKLQRAYEFIKSNPYPTKPDSNI